MKRISTMTVLLLTVVGCSGPESSEMNAGVPAADPLDAYTPTAAQHAEVVGTLQRTVSDTNLTMPTRYLV